eukprot:5896179-Prymnesium_polylepis.1
MRARGAPLLRVALGRAPGRRRDPREPARGRGARWPRGMDSQSVIAISEKGPIANVRSFSENTGTQLGSATCNPGGNAIE